MTTSSLLSEIIGPFFGFLFALFIYGLSQFIIKIKNNNKRCHRIINFFSLIGQEIEDNTNKLRQIINDLIEGVLPYYTLKKDIKDATWSEILELQHGRQDLINNISRIYSKYDMINKACDVMRQLGSRHRYIAMQIINHCYNAIKESKYMLSEIEDAVDDIKYTPKKDSLSIVGLTIILLFTTYILGPIQDNATGITKTVFIAPVNEELFKYLLSFLFLIIILFVMLFINLILHLIKNDEKSDRLHLSLKDMGKKCILLFQNYFVYSCMASGIYFGYLEYLDKEQNLTSHILNHVSYTIIGAMLVFYYLNKIYPPYRMVSFFFMGVSIFLHSVHNQYLSNYALGGILEDVGFKVGYYDTSLMVLMFVIMVGWTIYNIYTILSHKNLKIFF